MSAIGLVARNDLRRQFVRPWAWALLALVTVLLAWQYLLVLQAFLQLEPKLGALKNAPGVTDLVAIPLLRNFSNLLLLIVPLATMQSLAGERSAQTLPLLLASGLGNARIVLGKYFAALALVWLLVALAVAMPLALGFGAALDYGKLAAATLGIALYAAALTAIGVLCSVFAAQAALAAGAALVIGSVLGLLDAGARFQGIDNSAINWLALPTHVEPFLNGLVASVDIVYFLLLIVVALALAVRRLDTLRSRG